MATGPSLQVVVEASGSEKAQAQLTKLTQSIAGVGSASQQAAAGAIAAGGKIKSGFANAGTGALQLAYVMDDVQYGMRGVINNIPSLVMGFGMSAGVAGAISIAAIAVSKLWDILGDGGAVEKAKNAADTLKNAYTGLGDVIKKRGDLAQEAAKRELEALIATSQGSDEIRAIRDRIFEMETPETVAGAEARKARKIETASLTAATEKARQDAAVSAAEKQYAEARRGADSLLAQQAKLRAQYDKDEAQSSKELLDLMIKFNSAKLRSPLDPFAAASSLELADEIQAKMKDRAAKLEPVQAALEESHKVQKEAEERATKAAQDVAAAKQTRANSEKLLAAKMDLAVAEADNEIKKAKATAEEKKKSQAKRSDDLMLDIISASERRETLKQDLNQQAARFLNVSPFERGDFVADLSDSRLKKDPKIANLIGSIEEMTMKLDQLTKEMTVEQFTGPQ